MEIPMEEESASKSDKDKWIEDLDNMHIESAVMNRLVMDYLVTEGFKEAAEKFEEESGTTASTSSNTLDTRIKIRDAILMGSINESISLINEIHPELLDDNRILLFYLQLQQLIELIRAKKTEEALEFAQTQLSERGEDSPECLEDMERALALLAFDKPEESPFSDLLHSSQKYKLWSRVNTCLIELESDIPMPRLASLVKLLVWSQEQLDKKKVKYPKISNIEHGGVSDKQ